LGTVRHTVTDAKAVVDGRWVGLGNRHRRLDTCYVQGGPKI